MQFIADPVAYRAYWCSVGSSVFSEIFTTEVSCFNTEVKDSNTPLIEVIAELRTDTGTESFALSKSSRAYNTLLLAK